MLIDIEKIVKQRPLIHNITNYVVMNNTANALLCLGASPVMAHATQEVEEMVALAGALVVNVGTLSPHWVDAMAMAMCKAHSLAIPIVYDPVGAGATTYRNEVNRRLLSEVSPTIIRGNGSEIMALVNSGAGAKGVDSTVSSHNAVDAAIRLSQQTGAVVVISGAIDYIVSGDVVLENHRGTPMMESITGMGCTASAICGAFAAVNHDPAQAAFNAMTLMGVCGEEALSTSTGPGSFQVAFLDAIYSKRG